MNYFVISAVMRFIFNNCYNYFIKKRSHALWLSRQGLKLEGILIKSAILPPVRLALGRPTEMTPGVNNVCVGGKQAVIFTEEAGFVFVFFSLPHFHLLPDTERCMKKDTHALHLIKPLNCGLRWGVGGWGFSSKMLTF